MPNWYLSNNGNDSNTGATVATPIKSLSRLSQLIQRGDTAYIAPGTYLTSDIGAFSANNTGGSANDTDAQVFRILADTTGSIFGVTGGEVVIDGQGTTHATPLFTLPTTFSGRLVIKGIRVTRRPTSVVGALLTVPQATRSFKISFEDCVFDEFTTTMTASSAVGALVNVLSTRVVDEVMFKRCSFMMGNQMDSMFAISNNEANSMNKSSSESMLHFDDCTFSVKPATAFGSSSNWISLGRTMAGGGSSLVGAKISRCQFKLQTPTAEPTKLPGLYTSSSSYHSTLDVVDSDVNVYNFGESSGGASVRLLRSQVSAYAYYIGASTTNLFERSELYITNTTTAVFNALLFYDYSTLRLKSCLVDLGSGSCATQGSACALIAEDTLFVNIPTFNVFTNSAYPIICQRCSFVNCARHRDGSSVPNFFTSTAGAPSAFDEVSFSKLNATTIFQPSSSTSGLRYTRGIYPNIGNFSVNYSVQFTQGTVIRSTGSLHTLTAPQQIRFPDVVIPEMRAPIAGRQSAKIPVAGYGLGKFQVMLEAGRENSIGMVLQKNWTGGNVFFTIEDKVIGTASDVQTVQNIALTHTPERTGMYELCIYGADGSNNTYDPGYTVKSILIDSVIVA